MGDEASKMRGILSLSRPFRDGIVDDWNLAKEIWNYTYNDQLRMNSGDHNLLLTEGALASQAERERMCSAMFEEFRVPGLYIAKAAVLSLFSTGRTTGLVLESGDSRSYAVPVFEGIAIKDGIKACSAGGDDVTRNLVQNLQMEGIKFSTSAEYEIVRDVKETCCYVCGDLESERIKDPANVTMSYELPDGQLINTGQSRYMAPEMIFRPEITGEDSNFSLVTSGVVDSIEAVDVDRRSVMRQNIVLVMMSPIYCIIFV